MPSPPHPLGDARNPRRVEATRRFREIVGGTADDFPLDLPALLVSAHFRADLDIAAWLARLDDLASAAPASFDGLREHLFGSADFGPDVERYHDPANSMLDLVIERGKGIPLTLSVLMIEVGRRAGVAVAPVGMPGHFLVADPERPGVFCDPFAGGALLDEDGCRSRFDALFQGKRQFTLDLLAVTPPRAVLARLLANLENGPLRHDLVHLAWIVRLRAAIPGLPAGDAGVLAGKLSTLGVHDEAASLFDHLARLADGEGADLLRNRARAERARLN